MRVLSLFFPVLFVALAHILFTSALIPSGHAQSYPRTFKLVMFETRSCYYCQVFNQTILPRYEQHRLSYQAPLHRVDIDIQGLGGYSLKKKIMGTPTIIIFNRGVEVERITGYLPEKKFYKAVRYMIRKAKAAERRYQQNLEWNTSLQQQSSNTR